jgi:type I restriction enzyme S subunit
MPFLKSKTEQTLIAEILSTADRAIEQTEALIAKLQRIKTGLMQDLLTRGIDKHGNIRSEETHEFKDSPLGRIPVEWEVEPIDNYLIKGSGIKPGPFGSSLKKEIYTNSGYKVYGQEQVIEGSLAIGNYYIDKKRYHRMRTFSIKEGDVLISLVGTIGHVLIVRKPFEEGIINPRLLRFRPNLYKCYPPFLRYLLLSESTQIQLISLKTGGTMPVLSGTSIKKLIVPKIKKEEQEKIGHTIRFLEEMIEKENRYLGKLKLIKQALMQDLLTGKVRVTELLKKRQAEES